MITRFFQKKPTLISSIGTLLLVVLHTVACSKDEPSEDDVTGNLPCSSPLDLVFNESNGLVSVEFENAEFTGDWKLRNEGNGFSGKGYMVWQGQQHLHDPGNGRATFAININRSGRYRFLWKSAVKTGNNSTEHNDTWLRFADAASFYAQKGNSKVFPKGSGKTPNPEGATKDGWFKIYRNGNDLGFKWQALTYDNNGHEVFVVFENPGVYEMEVSARSSGHAIDQFLLFDASHTFEEATSQTEWSTISCSQ